MDWHAVASLPNQPGEIKHVIFKRDTEADFRL
jgi:hypothetical protein